MTWKNLVGETYPSQDWEKDETLEGILVEKRMGVGPNKSKLFVVENKKHEKISVWGSAVLDRLDTLPVGSLVKITYLGKEKGKRGTMYKNYDIQYDEETLPEKDVEDIPDDLEVRD
jgi:hypothetical protein